MRREGGNRVIVEILAYLAVTILLHSWYQLFVLFLLTFLK